MEVCARVKFTHQVHTVTSKAHRWVTHLTGGGRGRPCLVWLGEGHEKITCGLGIFSFAQQMRNTLRESEALLLVILHKDYDMSLAFFFMSVVDVVTMYKGRAATRLIFERVNPRSAVSL